MALYRANIFRKGDIDLKVLFSGKFSYKF